MCVSRYVCNCVHKEASVLPSHSLPWDTGLEMGWQLSGLSHPLVSVHIALGLWVYMAVPGSLLELEISIHILILVQQVSLPTEQSP